MLVAAVLGRQPIRLRFGQHVGAEDQCPTDVSAAARDRRWAQERIESIADKKRTTGLFY
jgi:hypothetical protein